MRLGFSLSVVGDDADSLVRFAREAESLGFDSLWHGESWGSDAVVPLTWAAAATSRIAVGTDIMQIAGRTPALAAMTAATLDDLSGGRMRLGLGVSGPQVVEGWHGQPYGRPLARTREYVQVVREILRREAPLEFHGDYYDIPRRGPDATGLGKALKTILHPRADIPVYLAAIGPRNIALALEIADGPLPIFWSCTQWTQCLPADSAIRPGFDIAPMVEVACGDDLAACRDQVRPSIARYVGGMGARGKNFYNELTVRYGFADAAARIQDAYLAGRQPDAIAAVPDELVDQVALVGPREHIADQLATWRQTPATTLILRTPQLEALRTLAELVL